MMNNKVTICTGVGVAGIFGGVTLAKYFKNKKELKELRKQVAIQEALNQQYKDNLKNQLCFAMEDDDFFVASNALDRYNKFISDNSDFGKENLYKVRFNEYDLIEIALNPESFKNNFTRMKDMLIVNGHSPETFEEVEKDVNEIYNLLIKG